MALEEKRKVVTLPEEREEMGKVINAALSAYGSVEGMQLVDGRADKIRIRDVAAVKVARLDAVFAATYFASCEMTVWP